MMYGDIVVDRSTVCAIAEFTLLRQIMSSLAINILVFKEVVIMNRLLMIGGICAALIAGMMSMGGADPIVNIGKVVYMDPATNKEVTRESAPAVINGPYLIITKEANKKNIKPGEEVEYVITVKNIGTKDAKNVIISDKFPDELELIGVEGHVYNHKGEPLVQTKQIMVDMQKIREGEEHIFYKKENIDVGEVSVTVKKGSAFKRMIMQNVPPGVSATFCQTGILR